MGLCAFSNWIDWIDLLCWMWHTANSFLRDTLFWKCFQHALAINMDQKKKKKKKDNVLNRLFIFRALFRKRHNQIGYNK